jgi:hypothetical protein
MGYALTIEQIYFFAKSYFRIASYTGWRAAVTGCVPVLYSTEEIPVAA